jgi:hypothetical protein
MADEAAYILEHKQAPAKVDPVTTRQTLELLSVSLAAELDRVQDGGSARPSAPSNNGGLATTPSHPPNWARATLAQAQLQKSLENGLTAEQKAMALMGLAILRNLRSMWNDISPAWVTIAQQTAVKEPARDASAPRLTSCTNPYKAR